MFFVLSKILAFLTQPYVWIIGCLVAAYFVGRKTRKKRLVWLAGGLFIFFSNQVIFDEFVRQWEVPGIKESQLQEHDVAIVLGGMAAFNKDLGRLSFGPSSDRIIQALSLYKAGKVKKILLCGDSGALNDDGLDEARQLKDLVVKLGFPEEDVWIETESVNTHENALFAADVLKKYPEYTDYVLVTSAMHMKRSLACFENVGIHCTPYSVDHITGKRWFSFKRLFVPSLNTLRTWHWYTHEVIGYWTYALMGYI